MNNDITYKRIYEYISKLNIIDTHEHLPYCEDERDKNNDVLSEYLTHYFSSDLVSAGLKQSDLHRVRNDKMPIVDKWEIVELFWDFARNTGYGKALDRTVKGLYGIDKISKNTIEELNEKYQATLNCNHFEYVLKEKSNIKISILDNNLNCDRKFFKSVYRLQEWINPQNANSFDRMTQRSGIKIRSFGDFLNSCKKEIQYVLDRDIAGFKCGLAYSRSLKFDRVLYKTAKSLFEDTIKNTKNNGDYNFSKKFQDFMMHFILTQLSDKQVTVQFHTGHQEGNGNIIYNSDPTLLSNLFKSYPDVKFDIFHIGYPYYNTVSSLAKMFPNVYIDMCWAHIISQTACVYALVEWLDAVPSNKISAFGGDYCFIDAVYGHQLIARENVAKALSIKVKQGLMDIDRACVIAKRLFIDNPASIFNI